jgi:two-component system, chemotaxis family, CheB/CheR fusion protein
VSPSLGDDGQAGSPEAEKRMTDVPGLSAERSGAGDDEELEELLRFIRDARGFDFTGYKRTSIGRRVRRRMHEVRTESIADYRDKLEADVDEFTYLFNTILINLTGFFRDASSWQYLQAEVLPHIISRRGMAQPIRIWSAGCATGEEPYTIAILMAELLGVQETARQVKIYATDLDLEALDQARVGVYSERSLADVPEDLRAKYFEEDIHKRGSVIIPSLRRTVVFGRLDLTKDPPISRVDLVTCRNTLMYLTAETQAYVIPRLQYALRDGGYLFLGRAEMVLRGGAERFSPVSLQHRIFVTMPHLVRGGMGAGEERRPFDIGPSEVRSRMGGELSDIYDNPFQPSPIAEVQVDKQLKLFGANDTAQQLFALTARDLTHPFGELPFARQPLDLESRAEQAMRDGVSIDLGVAQYELSDERTMDFEVRILPILDLEQRAVGASITFDDIRHTRELREGFRQLHEELETAYEELQSTNEELVTSNEELQSSYEELETSNEELQSANEELETTNEELRSANEELEATNIDLKVTTDAVEQLNSTLVVSNRELIRYGDLHRKITENFQGAIVVLNGRLLVAEWNSKATDMWGLSEEQVLGEPFFGLDFGLPLERLQDPVRACRTPGGSAVTVKLDAVNRLGTSITCTVSVFPIAGSDDTSVLLIMETPDALE